MVMQVTHVPFMFATGRLAVGQTFNNRVSDTGNLVRMDGDSSVLGVRIAATEQQ